MSLELPEHKKRKSRRYDFFEYTPPRYSGGDPQGWLKKYGDNPKHF